MIISLFLSSCAKIGSPTGGPKDENPPKVEESMPDNYSRNFIGDRVEITFDEYIQLKNLDKELLVSPPLKEKPITKLRNKTLIIDLNNELKDSTTYTFNFGNAIVDNNEGNPLPNFEFVVSTGFFLDSLTVTGNLAQAFDLKNTKDPVFVMLYENLNDSAPLTEIPVYIGKTDKAGNYTINNIKTGIYNVFALKDINSNLIFDHPDEEIAFADSSFVLDPSQTIFEENQSLDTALILKYADSTFFIDSLVSDFIVDDKTGDTVRFSNKIIYALHVNLFIFKEETSVQYLTTKERMNREKLLFTFNRPLYDSLTLNPLNFSNQPDLFLKEISNNNDTIIFWITDTVVASIDTLLLTLTYSVLDSVNNIVPHTDTLALRYHEAQEKKPAGRRSEIIEQKKRVQNHLTLRVNIPNNGKLDLNNDIIILSEKPSFDFDPNSVQLTKIVDSTETDVKIEVTRDTSRINKFIIHTDWEESTTYRLMIAPKAFIDIYGNSNDTIMLMFSTRELAYYCTLILNVSGLNSPVIIQLLDEKSNIIRNETMDQNGIINFKYLPPKSYSLKVIFDRNKNGKWDTGNYLKKIQPEQVKFYAGKIDIRSNWDIEINWNIE